MLSMTPRTLSYAINEMLVTVDTKVDNISDSTKRIKHDVGRVDRNIVKIDGQVTRMNDGILQMQKFQDGGYISFHRRLVVDD